jgi:hypothetical protein
VNRFTVNFRLLWLAFGLLFLSSNTRAQFVRVDGHADLNVLFVHDQTILFSKRISGAEDELFALDAKARTVRWRQEVKAIGSTAVTDTNGAFYMFARDCLQKRDLHTGKLIWKTQLDSIPQQKTVPKPTLSDRWQAILAKLQGGGRPFVPITVSFGGAPNRYDYKPVLSGPSLVVFREAMSGGGCVILSCFKDWLMFDRNTGKQTSAGSGERLGVAGSSLLVDDVAGFGLIRNGQFRDFSFDGLNSSQSHNSFSSRDRSAQYSWNGRCVFKNGDNEREEIFVYDAEKSKVDSFKLPVVPGLQVNWVLLDSNLLRYAECPAYSSDGKGSRGAPWFELYDLKGKLIARRETGALTNEHWFLSFLGTSPTSTVLFQDGDGRIVVETPSLRITPSSPANRIKRTDNETSYTYTSWHMDRGSRHLYEVQRNTMVYKMTGPQMKHAFEIKAVEATTGQRLWEYIEPTTIKRIEEATR